MKVEEQHSIMPEFQQEMLDRATRVIEARYRMIDTFVLGTIPKWQVKAMDWFPILKKFFGYEIRYTQGKPNDISLYKKGKLLGTLTITQEV